MADPEYRRRLLHLADFLVASLPVEWDQASVRVTFPDEVGTDFEIAYRATRASREVGAYAPSDIALDFARAAREVRAELVRGGSPTCTGFVFRLTKDGKSTLDVEY